MTKLACIAIVLAAPLHAQARPRASAELLAAADSFMALNAANYDERHWPDLSDSTRGATQRRVDSIHARLRAIDGSALTHPEQLVLENLTEAIDARTAQAVCRYEMWSGSNQFSGWHVQAANLARDLPVSTAAERADALRMLRELPRAIAAEQGMLQRGLDSWFTMAAPVAQSLVEQVDGLLPNEISTSRLFAPAQRTSDSSFIKAWRAVLADSVYPAARAYKNFLISTYVPRARASGSLSTLPRGTECYAASLRAQASTPVDLDRLMASAREDVTRRIADLAPLARKLTGKADVADALRTLRAGDGFTFPARDSVLPAYRAMTERAANLIDRVIAGVPPEPVSVIAYPEFQERTGIPPAYSREAVDGSRPAQFFVNRTRMERMSVADAVAHEAYPGHHIQHVAELRAPLAHPVMGTLFFGGFSEGWGIYSELLGDEMGLYATDLDRVGYLVHMVDVAMACYLDIGFHARGWTRDMLIDTMMVVAGRPRANAEVYADRHAATPGQLATYFIGFNEIMGARHDAESRLGERFDERQFNRAVIADGTTSLVSMRHRMSDWKPQ